MNLFTHHESTCAAIVDRMPAPIAAVFAPGAQQREGIHEVARLFGVYSGGRFYIDAFYGPAKASCRAHVLSALTGRKITNSKAGWNHFRDSLTDALGIDRAKHCTAEIETMIGAEFRKLATI